MCRTTLFVLFALVLSTKQISSQNPISAITLTESQSSDVLMYNHALYSIQTHLVDINENKNFFDHLELWDHLAIGAYHLLESRFENIIEYSQSLSKDASTDQSANLLRALYYFDQKDYIQSLTYFEQYPQSGNPEIWMKHGYALFATKQFAQATDKFALIQNDTEYSTPAKYYMGMSSYYLKDYSTAVQYLKEIDQIKPYKTYTPEYITQIYFAQKQYQEVINYGSNHLSEDHPTTHYLVGQSYYNLGNNSKALYHLSVYESATEKLSAEDFFQLGKLNQQSGNNQKALQYFTEIASMNTPISNHAKYLMASIHQSLNENEEAISLLNEVGLSDLNVKDNANLLAAQLSINLANNRKALEFCERISNSSEYYTTGQQLTGLILEGDSDIEGSLRYLESNTIRSDELDYTYQKLLLKKVELLGTNGDFSNIHQTISKADKSKLTIEQRSELHYWEGKSYFVQGNASESIVPLKKSITALQTNYLSDAHYMIGYAEATQGHDADANNSIINAIKYSDGMGSEYRKTLYMIGANTALGIDDVATAKNHYESAAKLGSDDAIAQLAKIAKRENDTYTRIYLLESLVELYPDSKYSQESYFELGESHIQLGKFTQAIKFFDKGIANSRVENEISYESYLRLGLCYYNLGKLAEATEAYQYVASNSPSGNQQIVAVNALKEVYLNDRGDPDAYFEFVESSTNLEINTVEKDRIAYSVGNNRFETADYDLSITAHQKYLQNYPDGLFYSDALYQIAESYLYQNSYTSALTYYQEYLSQQQRGNAYHEAMRKAAVIALNHTNAFDISYEYYDQLIEISTDPSLKKEAIDGALYSAIKLQNGEAGRLAEYVINDQSRSDTEKAKAYYHKGKFKIAQMQYDEAIQALTQVTRMNKSNIAAESNYLIADLFYKNGDLEVAERQAKESTKRSREYPLWIAKSLLLLSDIYIDKEDFLNAQAAAEAVMENYQENSEIQSETEEKLALIKTIMDSNSRVLPAQSDTLLFIDVNPSITPDNN